MNSKLGLIFFVLLIIPLYGAKNLKKHLKGKKTIILLSSAFRNGETLSQDYTCEGADISPPMSWSPVPKGTVSFVIICDDPDAPGQTWDHWIVYNIPDETTSIEAGFGGKGLEMLPGGGMQGVNSWDKFGYGGACPPKGHGVHRYFFRIYALDINLDFVKDGKVTKSKVIERVNGHVLGWGELMGTYSR